MTKTTTFRKLSLFCSIALIAAIGGLGIYEWISKDVIRVSTIFFFCLGISYFFNSLVWGDINGKYESNKNDSEKHITLLSSKISYYLLLVFMVIILFVSEATISMNELNNIPLALAIGLALVTHPITEFILLRKYRK